MEWFIHLLAQLVKEMAAFLCAAISILFGLSLAIASFELALAIQYQLVLLVACLCVAALVPVFLVIIPGFIYRWHYGFPRVHHS